MTAAPTIVRLLHTVTAFRPRRDPGPGRLATLLDALAGAGLKPPKAAVDAAAEAGRLGAEAVAAGGDRGRSAHERAHARDRLRHQAAAARLDALAALAAVGGKVEAEAGKIVAAAATRLRENLAVIPEHVTTAEAATSEGPETAGCWARVQADDRLVARVWRALDLARTLGVLAAPLTRQDFSLAASDLAAVLTIPGAHEGAYYAPTAHRCAEPGAISTSWPASRMLRHGIEPGVLGADEAKANVARYAAAVLASEPPSGARP